LPRTTQAAGGAVAVGPDRVELLGDGAQVAERLRREIEDARASVQAEIYEFNRADIAGAMLRALARGVTVKVISDPTVFGNSATLQMIRDAGGEVRLFPDGPHQIDHVKLLIVDRRIAYLGGMNWGAHSYRNRDFEVALTGPSVARLNALFEADLVRSGDLSTTPPAVPNVDGAVRIVSTWPDDEIAPTVVRALAGARHFVFIELYVLTYRQVLQQLAEAAGRGVAIFVLLDPLQDQNQGAFTQIRAAGGQARFYRTSGEKLHAKAAVIDGVELIVGSANWTRSGFTRNHELDVDIRSAAIANAALVRMEADWRASAN